MIKSLNLWLIFLVSALLEVGGDAIIRKGLLGRNAWPVVPGVLMLGFYGILVNTVKWDFSKMLGVYVAVFAVVSILWGRFLFHEQIPPATWLGLGVIVAGGMIIQFGKF